MRRLLLILLCAAVLASAKTPRPLADITFAAPPRGKVVKLNSYRGKVMVIVIFSTECSPCATAVQYLNRIQKDYEGKPVVMVAGAANGGAISLIQPFIDRYKITIPTGVLSDEDARRLADAGPKDQLMVPAFLFVDKKGVVRTQVPGDSDFFKQGNRNTHIVIDGLLTQ